MKKYMALVLAGILTLAVAGCGAEQTETKEDTQTTAQTQEKTENPDVLQSMKPEKGEEIAVITTSEGVIKLRLYPEEAPKAVENFKTLAKDGYYNGIIFHRVIKDFMIQTGDPTGTGTGGESCWGEDFEDEVSPNLHFYDGAVAMANRGPNTNGSQFFIVQNEAAPKEYLDALQEAKDGSKELGITLKDTFYSIQDLFPDSVMNYYKEQGGTPHLEYVFGNPYTIFGQVMEGMDTVKAIAGVQTDDNAKPKKDIVIENISFEAYGEK